MPSLILNQLDTFGPERCERLDYAQASEYTRKLVRSQYENFTVVSWLLPARLREGFAHVYAFCRWADDLGDETGDPQKSLELLAWWRREVDACYADHPRHPVFVALHRTIREHDIPREPFDHLIDAFVQDQTVTRYDTWEQTVDYCTRSANPVGRLVLYLCGYRDAQRQRLSDATCTALQLANFWQDVRRDILERDRVYIPADIAAKHGLEVATLVKAVQVADGSGDRWGGRPACRRPVGPNSSVPGGKLRPAGPMAGETPAPPNSAAGLPPRQAEEATCSCCHLPSAAITALTPAYRATLKDLVDRTWPLFTEGRQLWPLVARDVRLDIQLFTLGGESILKMIERANYNTLVARPSLSKGRKLTLLLRALWGKLTMGRGGQ